MARLYRKNKALAERFQEIRVRCDALWQAQGDALPTLTMAVFDRLRHQQAAAQLWVHSKDGEAHVGDMLVVARLVPAMRQLGWRLFSVSNPSLRPLLRPQRSVLRALSYDMPPAVLRRQLADVTHTVNWHGLWRYVRDAGLPLADVPYLETSPARVAALRAQLLGGHPGPLVGIVWRTSLIGRNPGRDSDLSEWEPLLRLPGVQFVSLQYGDPAGAMEDMVRAGSASPWLRRLRHVPGIETIWDLPHYADLVAATDAVVTVDCSTVFLAGGLGKPTWTLVPADKPSFRWGERHDPCSFFPHNHPVWQQRSGVWRPELAGIAQMIERHFLRGPAPLIVRRPEPA